MTELLLTDEEIKKALDTEVNEYFFEDKIPRYSQERAVAKAQATKAVTGVFERIVVFDWTTLDSLKAKLLDDIKEGK